MAEQLIGFPAEFHKIRSWTEEVTYFKIISRSLPHAIV